MPADGKRGVIHDEAVSVLDRYLDAEGRRGMMTPEQEQAAAQEIERLDLALWCDLMVTAPAYSELVAVIRRAAPKQRDLSFLPDAAPATDELRRALAEQLRAVDGGRLLAAATRSVLASAGADDQRRIKAAAAARDRRRNAFVTANLRLVIRIAKQANTVRLPLADLIQEGTIGLMKAVEHFDYRRGFRFTSHTTPWIRHAIGRALADKGRAIRLPVEIVAEQFRLRGAERKLARELGRNATNEELAVELGTTEERIVQLRGWFREDFARLDAPHHDGGTRTLADVIGTQGEETTDAADEAATLAVVRELIATLQPIEQDILRLRFNLNGSGELTLKEIGARYDLSRERIRQREEKVLANLKIALEKRDGLRPDWRRSQRVAAYAASARAA